MPNQTETKVFIKKRGNRLGVWFFKIAMRLTGLRGAYGMLYFVCVYYVLFDRVAFQTAVAYLKRRFPNKSSLLLGYDVYRLYISQGKNLIDRHALVAGVVDFKMKINGYDKLEDIVDSGKGFILLTSHTGNWQTVMAAFKKMDKTVHLLMRPEDNVAMRDVMQLDSEENRMKVISPDQYLGGIVEIMKALEQGDVVSIMGDRTYGADGVAIKFLGEDAQFPYSAFQIAASAKCPLAVMLSSKTGHDSYSVDIADVFYPVLSRNGSRKEQLQPWVQKYCSLLELYLECNPFQYFIFYDVWNNCK